MTPWAWIRCVSAILNYTVFAIGGSVISLLILPSMLLGRHIARRWGCFLLHHGWRFMVFVLRTTGIIRLQACGFEHARELRGCVVVANHPTLIDPVILVSLIPHSLPMAKGALRRLVFLRPIFSTICLMNDEDPAVLLRDAQEALERGYNIIIFPEGTRTTPGVYRPLRRGSARMALTGGGDIQPVRLDTSEPFLSKETPWWYAGRQRVTYTAQALAPIPLRQEGGEEEPIPVATRRLTGVITEALGLGPAE